MSTNLAKKLDHDGPVSDDLAPGREAVQRFGSVIRRAEEGALLVRVASEEILARRAFGCVIEPEVDDRVLLVTERGGDAYILTVLERRPNAPATLTHDGDLNIRLDGGKLGVAASHGVTVVAGDEVAVVSGAVRVTATEGELSLERLSVIASLARAEIGRAKIFGESLDTLVSRVSQRVKHAFRYVEELDQLKAKRIDYTAEQVMQMHAGNTVVTAEQLVKVDGEQIHLG